MGITQKIGELKTPCYVIDEDRLQENLSVLAQVQKHTGAKILLAQKAFACFYEYPMIGKYLAGTAASGLYEARLGYEEMKKENHVYSPAYRPQDVGELDQICDHIIFNSPSQLKRFGKQCTHASLGMRINPECSTQKGHTIYDPCVPGSRLGTTAEVFEKAWDEPFMRRLEGLHFHTLCEQNADDLMTTLEAVEARFGRYLHDPQIQWLNFGGGHHITRADYMLDVLEECIRYVQNKYHVQVYLEPGEAIALNAGYFITTVLDIAENAGTKILILDGSAACHMPDVLEMPYRPPLRDSGEAGEKAYTYRLGANTCLAGDIIGDYSFDHEVQIGDRLVFEDMAIYSMVKNNTFNGIPLPDIAVKSKDDCRVIRRFAYDDFKGRLA